MCAYFYGIINENYVLNDNPLFKMMKEANMFTKDMHKNVSVYELIQKYTWLSHFETLINSNCNMISNNLKYLRYSGYVMVMYNTMLMHVLLDGALPVSIVTCAFIVISLTSNLIDSTQIFLLGVFEIGQTSFTFMIMIAFIMLKEKNYINKET